MHILFVRKSCLPRSNAGVRRGLKIQCVDGFHLMRNYWALVVAALEQAGLHLGTFGIWIHGAAWD